MYQSLTARSYCLIYILCYQGWPQIAGIKGHQTRHSGRFYNILSHSNTVGFYPLLGGPNCEHPKTKSLICFGPNSNSITKYMLDKKIKIFHCATGENILVELPAIVAPAPSSTPVCVSCLGKLKNIEEDRCKKCNLPVCSQKCQDSIIHKPGK